MRDISHLDVFKIQESDVRPLPQGQIPKPCYFGREPKTGTQAAFDEEEPEAPHIDSVCWFSQAVGSRVSGLGLAVHGLGLEFGVRAECLGMLFLRFLNTIGKVFCTGVAEDAFMYRASGKANFGILVTSSYPHKIGVYRAYSESWSGASFEP